MAYTPPVLLLVVLIFGHLIHALPIGFCSPDNVASTGPTQSVYMSNGLCATRCTDNYAYAVIIGQSCYCSDDVPATQVSTDLCHDPCPGYPPDFCGNATAGYYAYFNLGRAASATIQLSTAAVSLSSAIVDGSTTAVSTFTVSSGSSASSATTGSSSSIVAIQQYIQSALSTQSGPDATDACFLNAGSNTRYTSPSWYQNAPTQVQSYFSSTHRDTSATCAALAATLFASPSHQGLSTGAKAGIIVGSILGALLIAALAILLCLCLRRRRRRTSERNSSIDQKLDEKPERAAVAAAGVPARSDVEHHPEHDYGHRSQHVEHGAVTNDHRHQQPFYHSEATVDHPDASLPPSTAAATPLPEQHPNTLLSSSPPSRTAMAAAALAWGRDHPRNHDSPTSRAPPAAALAWRGDHSQSLAHPHDSPTYTSTHHSPPTHVTAHPRPSLSQASSIYETPFETPLEHPQAQQSQHLSSSAASSSPSQRNNNLARPDPPPRISTTQNSYVADHQYANPYHVPAAVAGSSGEKSIPRKPLVGILKNHGRNTNGGSGGGVEAGQQLRQQQQQRRDSEKYTFLDDGQGDDDEYPFHAR